MKRLGNTFNQACYQLLAYEWSIDAQPGEQFVCLFATARRELLEIMITWYPQHTGSN